MSEPVVRIENMTPIERAYAEAMHEDCGESPAGHPLADHSPWSGSDLDGVESWDDFTVRLARHGLTLTLDAARSVPSDRPASGLTDPDNAALLDSLRVRTSDYAYRPLTEKERAALAAAPASSSGSSPVPAGLDGRAVHAAWRDGMLRQGREVAPERMTWDTLDQRDRDLDNEIAVALASPAAIDVERLARAGHVSFPEAEAIAREYDRLASPADPEAYAPPDFACYCGSPDPGTDGVCRTCDGATYALADPEEAGR